MNTSDLNNDEIISQIYDEIALQRDYTSGEITEGELKHYREAFGIAAQVVEEFSDEIQKYNSTLDAINNDLFSEKKYYLEQYSANKTITDSILGSGTAASDLAAGQAAFIQKSIFSDSSTEGDYEATIAALKSKGMDISGILSKSIIDGMIKDISEWHIKQDEWGDISKENKALLETIGIKKEEWDELGLEEMNDDAFKEEISKQFQAYLETQVTQLTAGNLEIDKDALNKDFSALISGMSSLTKEQFEGQKNALAKSMNLTQKF